MPYKSEAQRKYFNANRDKLEAEGVDVDEWNESSKGKKLPEKKSAAAMLGKAAADNGRPPEYREPYPNFYRFFDDFQNLNNRYSVLAESDKSNPSDNDWLKRFIDSRTVFYGNHSGLIDSIYDRHTIPTSASYADTAGGVGRREFLPDEADRIRQFVRKARLAATKEHREGLRAYNDANNQAADDRIRANALSRRQSRNTLLSTGGGAVAGGALANYLHRKYREDEGDEGSGLERNLITAAGGLGGGALGYGISRLMQSKKASHQEWNEMETLKEKKSGVISDLFNRGREAKEKHDKEQEKLDKAVARNMRERLARQIAKEKFAMDKEAIGGLAGGALGTLLGMRNAKKEGRPKRHGAEEGFVRGALTGSGAGIGGSLGLLGSLSLMQGKPSTTKGVLAAMLPLLGAGAGGYAGYQGSESLTKDMRKSREGLQDYVDDRQDEFDEETLESLAKRASAAGGIKDEDEDEDEDKQRGAGTPWGALGATAAGAAGLGTAYGIAGDKELENAVQGFRRMQEPLGPNDTMLSRYAGAMSNAAGLKPFGMPAVELMPRVRQQEWITGKTPLAPGGKASKGGFFEGLAGLLGDDVDTALPPGAFAKQKQQVAKARLAAAKFLRGGMGFPGYTTETPEKFHGARAHYGSFSQGPVAAVSHMMRGPRRHYALSPEFISNSGNPSAKSYKSYFGPKYEEFVLARTGMLPNEIDTEYLSIPGQDKLLQEFHASLSPLEQAEKSRIETGEMSGLKSENTRNYEPIVEGAAGIRNKLKQYGITAGGAGLGGLAGHGLYRALTDDDEESTTGGTLSSLAGMGLGGAGAYWSQTEQGKKHINDIISRFMSKK